MEPDAVETVFVAGASGGTGREVLRLLAGRVSTVRALTRSPDPDRADSLRAAGADEVVVDDLLDPTALAAALADVDVVVSAVGSTLRSVAAGGPFVDGAGNRALVAAAVDAGVEAMTLESAIGVGDEPASRLARTFDLAIGPLQRAKADAETALRDAPVRHTICRPGVLTDGPRTDDVAVAEPGPDAKLYGTVSRRDVARLLVAAPVTPAAADRTFEVVSRPRFRDRSLAIDWRLPDAGR